MVCSNCGKEFHNARNCPFKNKKMWYCVVCNYKAVDYEVNPTTNECPNCKINSGIINAMTPM